MNDKVKSKLREKLNRPEYSGVFDDLVAFTGLEWERVCELIRGSSGKIGAEFEFVNPQGSAEVKLFYRCCREYLFLNSYREVWPLMLKQRSQLLDPVLDFAGGCGNDSLWLARHGHVVDYHEISAIQREFVEFRVAQHEVNVDVLDLPECIAREYGTLMFRDVLEHAHGYAEILERLVPCLRSGGLLLEHSPWRHETSSSSDKLLHVDEDTPLADVLGGLGVEQIAVGVWRKA